MATSTISTRRPLGDRTNAPEQNIVTSKKRSRRQAEEQDASLDAKIKPPTKITRPSVQNDNASPIKAISPPPSHPSTQHRRVRQSRLGLDAPQPSLSSTRSYLESFVSSETSDVYRLEGPDDQISNPISCVYSHESKRGQKQLLAVALECGQINLFDTGASEPGSSTSNTTLSTDSLVYDVQWSQDDRMIAAACDVNLHLFDVETQSQTARFTGHTAAVKTLALDPNNEYMMASGSRDGNICIWDRRMHPGAHDVFNIKECHLYLISSGFSTNTCLCWLWRWSNSLLCKWDLRMLRNCKTAAGVTIEDPTTIFTGAKRPRGITSLALGLNDSIIYGLGSDASIYSYLTNSLQAWPMFCSPSGPSTDTSSSASFFSKLSLSPCGRWLASGGRGGRTRLYDVSNKDCFVQRAPVTLYGQAQEVTGLNWGNNGVLATCSDDKTVRIWRPNREQALRCRQDSDASWHWKWAGQEPSETEKRMPEDGKRPGL
ncbi:WD40 repeat-like protein [Serendipita vermifera]|nr:WD40 repeat-like protein [Serendipita vermifera]